MSASLNKPKRQPIEPKYADRGADESLRDVAIRLGVTEEHLRRLNPEPGPEQVCIGSGTGRVLLNKEDVEEDLASSKPVYRPTILAVQHALCTTGLLAAKFLTGQPNRITTEAYARWLLISDSGLRGLGELSGVFSLK